MNLEEQLTEEYKSIGEEYVEGLQELKQIASGTEAEEAKTPTPIDLMLNMRDDLERDMEAIQGAIQRAEEQLKLQRINAQRTDGALTVVRMLIEQATADKK